MYDEAIMLNELFAAIKSVMFFCGLFIHSFFSSFSLAYFYLEYHYFCFLILSIKIIEIINHNKTKRNTEKNRNYLW